LIVSLFAGNCKLPGAQLAAQKRLAAHDKHIRAARTSAGNSRRQLPLILHRIPSQPSADRRLKAQLVRDRAGALQPSS